MVDAVFEISLPYNPEWWKLYEKSGKTPIPHKFWELQVYRDRILFGFRLQLRTKIDHAGLFMSVSLFRFTVEFNFRDCRHWDYDNNCWGTPNQPAH